MIRLKKRIAALLTALLALAIFASCAGNKPGPAATDNVDPAPTERPTEVPMRDISNDTPLADTLLYANRIANEVQAYNTLPDRTKFTVQNLNAKFEFELAEPEARGISYFGDYYGKPYFTQSMDMYVIDSEGNEWSDRYSGSRGRQNTYRLGYYYTEVHLMDLALGLANAGEMTFSHTADIFSKNGWNANMVEIEAVDNGIKYTVTNPADPYAGRKLDRTVPEEEVDAVRIRLISDVDCSGEIYYFDTESGGFNGNQHTSFSIVGDGKEHWYYVSLPALEGDLAGVRLDANGSVGDVFYITGIEAVRSDTSMDVRTDRVYHVYSDKLHQALRFVAAAPLAGAKEYGLVWKVSKDNIDALQIRDVNGTHNDLSFDSSSVEYVAFHVKDNGVVGIIIPSEDSGTNKVTVVEENGYYVVRQFTDSPKDLKKGKDYTVGNRIYCDKNGTFDAIDGQAYLERHPLTDMAVGETNAKTKFAGYNYLRGCYMFTKKGSDFNTAYAKKNVNKYFTTDVTVNGDSSDRKIYMCFQGADGSLECAALLDENKVLVPVPMEVCKNFHGEIEEPFYEPADPMYGDSIFPLVVKSGKSVKFTELHLYQNWGVFPLKQISSIQFFIGYYHLSTGVTESNCIAPYYVYGKDGWTLPDFRGCSGVMWNSQPQFTSVGIHKWLSYTDADGKKQQSEYTGTEIHSSGPTYADIDYSYVSDCGSYKYTLRHVEFPQNDENRTYYTISVEFLKDLTIDDAREKFTLLHFNSRDNNFSEFLYLGADGNPVTESLPLTEKTSKTYSLNKDSFYYAIYGPKDSTLREKKGTDIMNYALIMRGSDVTVGGKKWDGSFCVRYYFDGGLDNLYLTFDEGKMEFKKGDTMEFDVILLPYGGEVKEAMDHAPVVYEDSVLHPVKITASKGTVIEDTYVPKILAEGNSAEFTVTGSRNRNTVAVYGFDVLSKPKIEVNENGVWKDYVTSVADYDGYAVAMSPDGTYVYSFVYEIGSPSDELTFRISAGK
ncbi:MAG: hypothetical protein IKH41_08315 [Clostridia bacterium]|nr:hypothetical protein [Clostridia bacterium]